MYTQRHQFIVKNSPSKKNESKFLQQEPIETNNTSKTQCRNFNEERNKIEL